MCFLFDQLIKDKQSREAKPQRLSAAMRKSACLETVYLFPQLPQERQTNDLFLKQRFWRVYSRFRFPLGSETALQNTPRPLQFFFWNHQLIRVTPPNIDFLSSDIRLVLF